VAGSMSFIHLRKGRRKTENTGKDSMATMHRAQL
jgi:hypothetical protein